jgi:hypothetical protein
VPFNPQPFAQKKKNVCYIADTHMLSSLPVRASRERALRSQLLQSVEELLPARTGQDVDLPLRLHLLPAMLQLLMDYGAMTTDHVGYQMMERLCLGALVGVGQLAERPFGRRAAARPDYRSLNALGR